MQESASKWFLTGLAIASLAGIGISNAQESLEERIDSELEATKPHTPQEPSKAPVESTTRLPSKPAAKSASRPLPSKKSAKAAKKPNSDELWTKALAGVRQESYVVQPGDTLPEISKTLFGDSSFWSKMWSLNRWIENPYNLKPGKVIWISAGTESEAPSVSVTDAPVIRVNSITELSSPAPTYKEDSTKHITKREISEGMIEESEIIPRPAIPPGPVRAPFLKSLPPSFVARRSNYSGQFDSTGLLIGERKTSTEPAQVIPNSFLTDSRPSSIGTVEEIERGDQVAGLGQNVFLRLNRDVEAGSKLAVLFVKNKLHDAARNSDYQIIEVGGVVEVTKSLGNNYVQAMVTYGQNPIRVGSLVSDEALPRVMLSQDGPRRDVAAKVLGGDLDPELRLFGRGSVVYLSGGQEAGISSGDLLAIQARQGGRQKASVVPDASEPIAVVKVFKSFGKIASAFVLESKEEIMPGDRTGSEFPVASRPLKIDSVQSVSKIGPIPPSNDESSPMDDGAAKEDLDVE